MGTTEWIALGVLILNVIVFFTRLPSRGDLRDFRNDLRDLRNEMKQDMNSLRQDINNLNQTFTNHLMFMHGSSSASPSSKEPSADD